MISTKNGIDQVAMKHAFDDCIGTDDESSSLILRLNLLLETDMNNEQLKEKS